MEPEENFDNYQLPYMNANLVLGSSFFGAHLNLLYAISVHSIKLHSASMFKTTKNYGLPQTTYYEAKRIVGHIRL